jgi:hypothetical protein
MSAEDRVVLAPEDFDFFMRSVRKHLAGKHDQQSHGRWAKSGVPHMAGDYSMMDRLRQSGAISTVKAVPVTNRDGEEEVRSDTGRTDYRIDYPPQSVRSLDNRGAGHLPYEEIDALDWFAKKEDSRKYLPHVGRFISTLHEEHVLGNYRDEGWTDEQAAVFLAAASTMESMDVAETFLDAYRLAKADGLSETQARTLGQAQVLRTGRHLLVENGEKAAKAYDEALGNQDWGSGDFQWQRFRPSEEQRAEAKTIVADGQVAVAVHSKSLPAIIADGALKNQYQSGESSGMYSPAKRRMYETAYIGVDVDAPAKDRPIYGYAFDPSKSDGSLASLENTMVNQYGDVRLVLKPEVRDRTTITGGDSLDKKGLAVPLTGKLTESDYRAASLYAPASYYETQIHRGVKMSDVARIHIPLDASTRYEISRGIDKEADTALALDSAKAIRQQRDEIRQMLATANLNIPVTAPEFITLFDGTVIPIGD